MTSLWTFARRAFGIFIGADFGFVLGYSSAMDLSLVMQVSAYLLFVPVGAVAGFFLFEAAA